MSIMEVPRPTERVTIRRTGDQPQMMVWLGAREAALLNALADAAEGSEDLDALVARPWAMILAKRITDELERTTE